MEDKRLIILSSGHGTRWADGTPVYPGKSSPDGRWLEGEQCYNIKRELFFNTGDNVMSLQNSPWDVPMKQRAKCADAILAASDYDRGLLMELHTNAGTRWGWHRAEGTVVFHYPGNKVAEEAANIVIDCFKEFTELKSRGVKTSRRLGMLRMPKLPSIIVEMFFHTNKKEVEYALGEGGKHINTALNKAVERIEEI